MPATTEGVAQAIVGYSQEYHWTNGTDGGTNAGFVNDFVVQFTDAPAATAEMNRLRTAMAGCGTWTFDGVNGSKPDTVHIEARMIRTTADDSFVLDVTHTGDPDQRNATYSLVRRGSLLAWVDVLPAQPHVSAFPTAQKVVAAVAADLAN